MKNKLEHFPISFFSIVMGLAGFSIAMEKLTAMANLPELPHIFSAYASITVFIILLITYLFKAVLYFDEVKNEFKNPIKINFFPTISISLLLLSIAFMQINPLASKYMSIIGICAHFIMTLAIVNSWMHMDHFKIAHFNPAWFIPAVGNLLIPISGTAYFPNEISYFFFSFGLIFWIILMVIFFYRIFFHESISEKFLPTLFILIAPPAVGFISYFKLTGRIDDFSKILYYFSLFMFILLLSQLRIFIKIKYYLSWWAYSFPLAALSIASALMFTQTGQTGYKFIFYTLMALLSALITILVVKTAQAIYLNKICVEE